MATEPVLAGEGPLADADIQAVRSAAQGSGEIVLLNTASFGVNVHRGYTIAARGLLYREPGQNRLTLTALHTTGSACPN